MPNYYKITISNFIVQSSMSVRWATTRPSTDVVFGYERQTAWVVFNITASGR